MLTYDDAMWVLWIILVICIALLLKTLLKSLDKLNSRDDRSQLILKKRYARGEIDEKEYQQLKKETGGE